MPKITEAKRESRRQQILDAALTCFSRNGFHNTTTSDIVRESGVAQGTLYLYFKTKDEIIAALADDRHQGEAYITALAQSEPDPLHGLALLIEIYGRSLNDPRRSDMRRVGVQGWGEALRNPAVHESAVAGMTAVRNALVRLIARGQKAGEFRADIDAEATARILIATFQGLTLQTTLGETLPLEKIGAVMGDMIRKTLFTDAARKAATSRSFLKTTE
jgi:AcrR family transcriptional regulator